MAGFDLGFDAGRAAPGRRCGAWAITGGVVQFRIFLPAGVDARITAITAGGSFQADAWQFESGVPLVRDTSDPRGDFWTGTTAPLAEGFYEYKYLVSFENGERRIVTDPCARYGGLSSQNSAVVVGGITPADNVVRPLAGGRLPLADLNVYELMIDDFTAEYRGVRAPLDAVVEKLDDLVALGINAILFMTWTAWKNTVFDWGYEPFQYYAVEARYANDLARPAEKLSLLKGLVSECHDRGLHVIMDGVFNHVSLSFPYQDLYQDRSECPYTAGPFGGSFPGLQDLDFANACTGELILDVCRYWTETFDLDGLRLDNTVNYYVAGDFRGLPELLSSHSSSLGRPNFSLTLERIDVSAASVTNSTAATSFWDNFADAAQDVLMFFPVDGVWADQLAGFSGDGSTWSLTVTGRRATVNVGSHWGAVAVSAGAPLSAFWRWAPPRAPHWRRSHRAPLLPDAVLSWRCCYPALPSSGAALTGRRPHLAPPLAPSCGTFDRCLWGVVIRAPDRFRSRFRRRGGR